MEPGIDAVTLQDLINIATAAHNSELNQTEPSQEPVVAPSAPANMYLVLDTGLPFANDATADLQRQLVTTWDNKRVKE
jgi:hypothetical protein